jgi:hypothetical protein
VNNASAASTSPKVVYADALKEDLPMDVLDGLLENHDRVKAMRDTLARP